MAMTARPGGSETGRTRVLMVSRLFHPWIGGTERQAALLARAMIDAGVDVRLVTGRWFRGTPRREVLDGVPVFRNQTLWEFFSIRGLRKLGGYLYIASLLLHLWTERGAYDVIHVHGLNYHTAAAVTVGRRLGKPVLVKLANSGPASDITKMREDRQLALSRFMLPTALSADRFVALNGRIVDELRSAGVAPECIVEVPNGVESDHVLPRESHDLHDPPCILYVGRLHRQKGLDTLLRAYALLLAECGSPPPTLRLVGDGPARPELEALGGRLGVAGHVTFAGSSDEVPAAMADADVLVLPSRAEGLSNALLEAMASALPVVVSDIPGNRDVVTHDRNGLLAQVDDPRALADQLRRVLDDGDLRRELGFAARRTVEERYAVDAVAARYVELYRELIDRTGDIASLNGGRAP